MHPRIVLILNLLAGVECLVVGHRGLKPICQDNILINISPTAVNVLLPYNLNLSAITASELPALANQTFGPPNQKVSGHYTISARYCEPQVYNASRHNTIQLLVHGDGYDKNYWSGLGPPGLQPFGTKYSWIDYASQQGYPTLSIDRLCNGNSSKPNGTLTCQIPMNAEAIHSLIPLLKNGAFGARPMSTTIFIGHSEGSVVGNALAQLHPTDIAGYVLTGFTPYSRIGGPGTLVATAVRPAAQVSPFWADRAPYAHDPGYLTETNATGTRGVFYFGDFDPRVAAYDYAHRGTTTVGEFATAYLGQGTAGQYTGAVFALCGQEDQIFCARSVYDPLSGNLGNCGPVGNASAWTEDVRGLYPRARYFGWSQTPRTGHVVNLHDSYLTTFQAMQNGLVSMGF